jgi:hypothetical protein
MLEMNNQGEIINSFGKFDKNFIIYSWAVAIDEKDQIYVCNKHENTLYIYGPNRKLLKNIRIISPSTMSIGGGTLKIPQTANDLVNNKRKLSQIEHTFISRVYANKDTIFILHDRRGGSLKQDKFVLDIFDSNGHLLFYGAEMPGELFCVTDKMYFARHDSEEKYGTVFIKGISLKEEIHHRLYDRIREKE